MSRGLIRAFLEGVESQNWRLVGFGGTYAGAMRPVEAHIERRIAKAVREEREACAKVCDVFATYSSNPMNFAENCADAIRARRKQ